MASDLQFYDSFRPVYARLVHRESHRLSVESLTDSGVKHEHAVQQLFFLLIVVPGFSELQASRTLHGGSLLLQSENESERSSMKCHQFLFDVFAPIFRAIPCSCRFGSVFFVSLESF